MKTYLKIAAIAGVVLAISSCSMRQEIALDDDGSGQASFEMETAPFFYDFLNSFLDIEASVDQSRFEMEQSQSMEDVVLEEAGQGKWEGSFRFSQLNNLLNAQEEQLDDPVFLRNTESGVTDLTIRLNKDNFQQLSSLFPLLEDPYLASFGPEGSSGSSKAEYEEMVVWTFEDSVDDPEIIRRAFRDSFIELDLSVPGEIISQSGGEQISGKRVIFRVPLLDVLVLNDELVYNVSYR